jgi:hypothetical protein
VSGQYMLEQTIDLPLAALYERERSPLAILERLSGRELAATRWSAASFGGATCKREGGALPFGPTIAAVPPRPARRHRDGEAGPPPEPFE